MGLGLQALLARGTVRRGFGGLVAIVVVATLGLGAALTSIEAAERTRSAYPDYLERADVADLVVNPVLANPRTEELIETTPGVRRVVSDSLLNAGPMPYPGDQVGNFLQTRMSQDGRYLDQDRPVVRDGRMIGRSGQEAFLDVEGAEVLGVEVGDEMTLGFFGVDPEDPAGDSLANPLGRSRVRVVGIGTFADEPLPQVGFPRTRILVTPDVAAEFDCLQQTPDPTDEHTADELIVELVGLDCAMSYRYYSIDVEGGRDRAAAVSAELGRRFRDENAHLPAAMRQAEIGYFLIPSFTADDARSVEQSLSPIITALRAFGVTAALATVVGVLVLVLRHLRRREREVAVWRSLGLGAAGRSAGIGIGPVAAAALGALGGAVAALAASPVGPVASARTIVPRPGHSLTAVTLGAGVAALFLLVVPTAVLAWRTAVRARTGARARRRPSWEASLPGSPMAALGLRVAFRGRDAMPAILGAASAVTVVTATLVFATGLDQLVDTPTRFGWPFDLAVLGNAGYGPVDREAIAADLDRPGVDGWGLATLTGNLTIDGETAPILAGREGFDALVAGTSVVDGHVPTGADEIGIGARTADDLGVGVGDEVTIGSPYGEHDVQVSGIVVLPTVGPLESDSTSVGTGALLPAPLLEATYDGAEEATGMTPVELADVSAALVVVDLAPGVDPQAFVDDLGEGILRWDGSGAFLRVYAEPLRPAAIIDVAAMRGVPALLAGVFGLAMIGTVVAGLISGTRARRHEIAVLRALGATPRQRGLSIRVHAVTTMVVGLVVGLPLGVLLGRLAFRYFADLLGVAPDLRVAVLVLAGVAGGAVLVAFVTAEALSRARTTRRPLPTAEVETTGYR